MAGADRRPGGEERRHHREIESLHRQAEQLRQEAAGSGDRGVSASGREGRGERQQTELRRQSRDKAEERENLGREAARLEEKCAAVRKENDDVLRRLLEEYELTRSEAEAVAVPVEDPARASRRLAELKNQIRALGSVNVEAIEEYKEVSQRYEFLSAQVEDVETSKRSCSASSAS